MGSALAPSRAPEEALRVGVPGEGCGCEDSEGHRARPETPEEARAEVGPRSDAKVEHRRATSSRDPRIRQTHPERDSR